MTSQLLTLLLLGVILGVYADSSEQQAMLRAFTLSCLDCTTLQYGTDPAALTPHECQAGTVCGPVGAGFSCISEDSADAASCSCGGQENTYIAEPYDSNKYIVCLPDGEQTVLQCPAGETFTGDAAAPCGTGPECTDASGAQKGFNALLSETTPENESCRKSFFCADIDTTPATKPSAIGECAEGEVFDVTTLKCVDPCTLAPEPFVCEADGSGPFPDPEDCGVFHLCFNGVKIGEPIPCPVDQFYSDLEADMKCKEGKEEDICTTQAENVVPCYKPYQAECAQR